ncbi:N-acetylmuramoyl-L-alanine amidase [Flavobacterium sp. GT3R68]|uniref:N-acetylmuramoyl-L-alanine amidase family protein n=1 Tax=Flavobacterium sp. GT3R68 TaxID=2594437 RepID=UPI000F863B1C|nr:N-acetylmuramoyl-L-alanine amidase [Flavobacterium sp. GT3R68]RTY87251.1 N-acetylmuramoyl-L-alanine amidase [Flavobacterium sp. GSN2]TRW89401.1 N-acetylmuramoyl-L-alanine amidase [Flavobacterium sp. GT3R68]
MKNTTKLFLALTSVVSFAFVKPSPEEVKQINIVIDAGHGGSDMGAKTHLFTEKQIVEQITHKIYAMNTNKNVVIHLTRSSDIFVPLEERTKTINALKPDLVLSLHVNSSKNKSKSGMEMYVAKETPSAPASHTLATQLCNKFSNTNLKTSEIKTANYHILKKSQVPTILIDLGYLSNENDRKYLTGEEEQNQIAQTIVSFISELK